MSEICVNKAAFGVWRVNPAQDRRPSEIKEYTLSPEELAKYSTSTACEPYKRPMYTDIKLMVTRREGRKTMGIKAKFTREELLAECKIYGTGRKAYSIIGEKYGLSPRSVESDIYKWGIHKELHFQRSTMPVEDKNGVGNDSILDLPQKVCTEQIDSIAIDADGKDILAKPINKVTACVSEDKLSKYYTSPTQATQAVILDSGERREFTTGAVRDIAEGKGRCDLLPLKVIGQFFGTKTLSDIDDYIKYGQTISLLDAIMHFTDDCSSNICTALLETSIQYEQGCKKYGDRNWEKGMPLHCYIDSAVRHYLKYKRGDKDEYHDRAFMWNILGAIWTHENKPELIDLPFKEADGGV